MQERLLQFIWQCQYFNHRHLHTAGGEPLQVLLPGTLNTAQGPDFLHASIRIGETRWSGNIELHIRNSDWDRHAHQHDKFYRNVILHVVWEDDLAGDGGLSGDLAGESHLSEDLAGEGGLHGNLPGRQGPMPGREDREIPLLVLQHRVSKFLLGRYDEWMRRPAFIPCEGQIGQVESGIREGWLRRLLHQRLQDRSLHIGAMLRENHHHWEETLWWLLARNFGLPVNAASFEAIARSLPLRIIGRHQGRADQLEALLLGQAGLLDLAPGDEYSRFLQDEFHHLRSKYRLPLVYSPVLFLRMRPGNFPTVRLAQLAALLSRSISWFSRVKDAKGPEELRVLLEVRTGEYWDDHYILGVESALKVKTLGAAMKDSLLINSLIPMLYAYGDLYREDALMSRALQWLEEMKAEKNAQIAGWGHLGLSIKNAADTQALLELKKNYCGPKKCLDCAIGQRILTKPGSSSHSS